MLNDFLDKSVARNLKGSIVGDVNINGALNDLETDGTVSIENGEVRIVPAGINRKDISTTLQFEPDGVILTQLKMISDSGNMKAKGTVALENLVPEDIDISLNAENFKVSNTDEYNGIINLTMDVSGNVNHPQVNGKLRVVNGFVELYNFGGKSVEDVTLDSVESTGPDVSLCDSLSLDMEVEFNRRFYLRNKRHLNMELELDGGVELY